MTAQFAFCRLSGGVCLEYRCPLAERTGDLPILTELRLAPIGPTG